MHEANVETRTISHSRPTNGSKSKACRFHYHTIADNLSQHKLSYEHRKVPDTDCWADTMSDKRFGGMKIGAVAISAVMYNTLPLGR